MFPGTCFTWGITRPESTKCFGICHTFTISLQKVCCIPCIILKTFSDCGFSQESTPRAQGKLLTVYWSPCGVYDQISLEYWFATASPNGNYNNYHGHSRILDAFLNYFGFKINSGICISLSDHTHRSRNLFFKAINIIPESRENNGTTLDISCLFLESKHRTAHLT